MDSLFDPIPTRLEELDHLDQLQPINETDNTPSTVTTALPTPNERCFPLSHDDTNEENGPLHHPLWVGAVLSQEGDSHEISAAPGAPMIKDFDSFTDGTGAGSFDCLSEITASGELCAHPVELQEAHVAQMYVEDSIHSIVMWREDVIVRSQQTDEDEEMPLLFADHPEPVDDGCFYDFERDLAFDAGATPQPKRPRSVTSEDGRKRTRVESCTTTAFPRLVLPHLPMDVMSQQSSTSHQPIRPRRQRSGSAPAIFSGHLTSTTQPS